MIAKTRKVPSFEYQFEVFNSAVIDDYNKMVDELMDSVHDDVANDIPIERSPLVAARIALIRNEKFAWFLHLISELETVIIKDGIGKEFVGITTQLRDSAHDFGLQVARCYAANSTWADARIIDENDWLAPALNEDDEWTYCDKDLLDTGAVVKRIVLDFDMAADRFIIDTTAKYVSSLKMIPGDESTYQNDGLHTTVPDFIEDILDPDDGDTIFSRVYDNYKHFEETGEIAIDIEDILSVHRPKSEE